MNKERGERTITIDGKDYDARPSHDAMAHIEGRTGLGIIEIASNMFNRKGSAGEITAIIYYCVYVVENPKKPRDMPWTLMQLQKLLFKKGMLASTVDALALVTAMVSGETEEETDEKNESSTDTETA